MVAAPLDALQVRFENRERHYENKSMWAYAKGKLREIGVRGIFAGWGLSFLRDSLGAGIFFSVFEYVKAQSYYRFIGTYYYYRRRAELRGPPPPAGHGRDSPLIVTPHYGLEPGFLMLAGVAASVAQQGIIYPLSKIQTMHYERLEDLDRKARAYHHHHNPRSRPSRATMMKAYYNAYQETWRQCQVQGQIAGGRLGLAKWLFGGFWRNSIRQTPATSAGLVIFELVRRRYGIGNDQLRITTTTTTSDGYHILLS